MPSEHRLHPLSFIFSVGSSLRAFLFPAILAFFAARSGRYEMIFAFFLIPYAVFALIRYVTYRYAFAEKDLVIRTGLIFRNERNIPYARIHNVGSVQNIFHRMFGVVEVVLETAGGQEPEARLQVLSVRAMEEMKRRILAEKEDAVAPVAAAAEGVDAAPAGGQAAREGRTLLRLPLSELVVLGIVENRGMIVVGAAMGVAWELGWLGSDEGGFFRSILRQGIDTAGELMRAVFATGLFVAAGVVVFLILVRVFSIIWAIVKMYDFHLQTTGRDLTVTSGLLTRVTGILPLHRIQVIHIRQKPLHRAFGRAEVRVEIAGGGEESEERITRPKRLAPLIVWSELPRLLAEIQPGIDLDAVDWQPVDPRARRRILRVSLFVIGLITVALGFMFSLGSTFPFNLLPLGIGLALVPIAHINARMQVRHYGYALADGVLLVRAGWIWRRWSMARFSKIQAMALTQSPFDRRYDMAEVHPDTAGAGAIGGHLAIPYLPSPTARAIFDRLSTEAAHTAFRW